MNGNALQTLRETWLSEAETLERYRDERGAALCRLHAEELEAAERKTSEELLTLAQASALSGYSEDHLRHLVAEGAVPNAGERGRPRIRRGDVPLKPGPRGSGGFDAAEVAGQILGKAS